MFIGNTWKFWMRCSWDVTSRDPLKCVLYNGRMSKMIVSNLMCRILFAIEVLQYYSLGVILRNIWGDNYPWDLLKII